MIARIQTLTVDGDSLVVSVMFLDGTPLAEVGVRSFVFGPGTQTIQARADIVAAGKTIRDKKIDLDRLTQALQPGTEYTL